jgi:dTDP-4-amino-4,6-dideoxygalactose transaminase
MEDDEIAAAVAVLRSGQLWQYSGDEIASFEQELADYVGARLALAVNTGTTNMEIALAAAGVGPGDEVITTPFTFIATSVAILRQNAVPVFVDIDPATFNMSPQALADAITERTKAILPVSIFGHPVDMEPMMAVARRYGLPIIDDAAQSLGAEYRGRKVGALAHVTCFSFTAPKPITTAGEGGMITTDSDELAERMSMIRNFGYDRVKCLPTGRLQYDMLGWNARLTQLQGAVGRVQLRKLDRFNARRIENAQYLTARLRDVEGVIPPAVGGDVRHVFWQYTVRLQLERLRVGRDALRAALRAEGIETAVYYDRPIYRQPYFLELRGYGNTSCPFRCPWYGGTVDYAHLELPVVERTCREVLSLPVHNLLTAEDMERVAGAVEKVVAAYRN